MYSVSFNGKPYIGSAKNVKERWGECTQGKRHSQFIQALQDHGHRACKWKVLETTMYSGINELYRVEDKYIDEYNSNQCGYNTSYNIKQHTIEVNTQICVNVLYIVRSVKETVTRHIYYDIEDGFDSRNTTYRKANNVLNSITAADVNTFLNTQPSRQQ